MNSIDIILTQAVKAILIAASPDGLPEDFPILALGDTDPQARPDLVCLTEDGSSDHPLMRKATLVLRLRTRVDETSAQTSSEWMARLKAFLDFNPASLYSTLLPLGLKLKKFTPGLDTAAEEVERARTEEQRWTCVIQKLA